MRAHMAVRLSPQTVSAVWLVILVTSMPQFAAINPRGLFDPSPLTMAFSTVKINSWVNSLSRKAPVAVASSSISSVT